MNIYDNTKLLTPEELIALEKSVLDISFDWIDDSVDVFINHDEGKNILQVLIEDDEGHYFGYCISYKRLIEELEEYI